MWLKGLICSSSVNCVIQEIYNHFHDANFSPLVLPSQKRLDWQPLTQHVRCFSQFTKRVDPFPWMAGSNTTIAPLSSAFSKLTFHKTDGAALKRVCLFLLQLKMQIIFCASLKKAFKSYSFNENYFLVCSHCKILFTSVVRWQLIMFFFLGWWPHSAMPSCFHSRWCRCKRRDRI